MPRAKRGSITFAKIVASLRNEKRLTQAELAELANLEPAVVTDIEGAYRAKVDASELLALARAFKLSDRERKEFFAAAIDLPRHHDAMVTAPGEIIDRVLELAGSIRLPTFVFDAYLDVIAATPSVMELLAVPVEMIASAESLWSGYSMLRIVFDPASGYRQLIGERSWRESAATNIHLFRAITLQSRVDSERYNGMVSELSQLPDFLRYWQVASWDDKDFYTDAERFAYPHPQFGPLRYLYLSTSIVTYLGDLQMVSYVPGSRETTEAFESIQRGIEERRAAGEMIPPIFTFSSWPQKQHPRRA